MQRLLYNMVLPTKILAMENVNQDGKLLIAAVLVSTNLSRPASIGHHGEVQLLNAQHSLKKHHHTQELDNAHVL